MRVALDARRLQDRPLGGVGRILANLLGPLSDQVDLELLTDRRRPPLVSELPQHPLSAPAWGRGVAWLQLGVPAWLARNPGVAVFHCPFYGLPYRSPRAAPMVASLHDLSFETRPEWFTPAQRLVFRAQGRHAGRAAARILTGSEHVRAQIAERYRVHPERVLVARPGVDPGLMEVAGAARTGDLDGRLAALGVARPYVVALGGAPRRGLATALAAWRLARAQGAVVGLVTVGPEALAPETGLVTAGVVDDQGWALLLAGAEVLCYPTQDEGVGLPALEAVATGTPVVCAPVGALPEVLGQAAAWCRSTSPADVAAGLMEVLGDPARAQHLRAEGSVLVAERGGWGPAAAATLRAYREAAGA